MPDSKLQFIGSDTRPDNDSFRRLELAKSWATALSSHSAEDCLVVGVEGEWGAGKSTFADYLITELEAQDPKPIVVRFERRSNTQSNTLAALREDPNNGLLEDKKVNPREFNIALPADMGIKKGNLQGSFVESVQTNLQSFYREVVQVLKPWQQSAPKLPEPADSETS